MVSGEGDPGALLEARANQDVAHGVGIGLREFLFRDATSLESALVGVRQMQARLLIVISGPLPLAHRNRLIAFATEARHSSYERGAGVGGSGSPPRLRS